MTQGTGRMSAYKDAFAVDSRSSDQSLALAVEVLARRMGVVMFEHSVALRRMQAELLCEVVDPSPSNHRCDMEFEVLVENARRALEGSRLGRSLPDLPRRWLVVEDNGTRTVELWHAP